jgi:hypothetical protein
MLSFIVSFLAQTRFYFSILNVSILSAATVEAAAQVHWVARAVSLILPTILTPGITN